MKRWIGFIFPLFVLLFVVFAWLNFPVAATNAHSAAACAPMGWFSTTFGLKDHTVFTFDGRYYLASIDISDNTHFAYGVSDDLCGWTTLNPILAQRPALPWNETVIWAPDVLCENGVCYMFYTSVESTITQRIALATSTNPAEPASWVVDTSFVFTPTHSGAVWSENTWADMRDPHVFRLDGLYYLLYTGRDVDGGIVGLATAPSLTGPWQDFGSILTLESGMPESPTMFQANGGFYLLYNRAGAGAASGEKYRFGPAPGGPWSAEMSVFPAGWAHEVWSGLDGKIYGSYLTNYTVTIAPLIWNRRYTPPQPFFAASFYELFVPLVQR